MRAVVLTFDKQVGFAELVYKKYMELWPNCPITFRIPYNSKKSCASYDYFNSKDNVELIISPPDIRRTMSAMLSDIDGDEWVFWCIDDRYPIRNINDDVSIDESLSLIFEEINSGRLNYLNRIKISSKLEDTQNYDEWKKNFTKDIFKISNIPFFKEPAGVKLFRGVYCHTFIKAKVLKYYFLRDSMPEDYSIREFHRINKNSPPDDFPWEDDCSSLISKKHMLSFGEPAIFGMLTMNGLIDLQKYGCPIPDYDMVLCTRYITNKPPDRRRVGNYRIKKIGNMALPVISLTK